MTFVESSFRRNAIVGLVALVAAASRCCRRHRPGAAAAAQRLSRHQRQSQSRARHLLSGHPRRAGARADQHPRLPWRLHLVRCDLPGQSRLDALDLSAGLVSGQLLFAARLRAAARLSRRLLRSRRLLGPNYRDRPFYRDRGRWGAAPTAKAGPIGRVLQSACALRELDLAPGTICLGAGQCRPPLASLHGRPLGLHRALWLDVGLREPFGWATYHYGRWGFSNRVGWFWVPGSRWAPAWVSWRSSNDYLAWAPLPPTPDEGLSINIRVGTVPDYYWQVVPNRDFLPPICRGGSCATGIATIRSFATRSRSAMSRWSTTPS